MVIGIQSSPIAKRDGRTPKELAFRIRQHVWNLADRIRTTAGLQTPDDAGVDWSKTGRFFIDDADGDRIRSLYAAQPKQGQVLIDRADAVCAGRYKLLGYTDLSFVQNGSFDWHYDPVNGVPVQRKWWQQMQDAESLDGADPKVVWELNRHQHLVTLAQAYGVSRDEKYRTEIVRQLQSWMDANPPKHGLNWTSSLELAFRSISWLWAWFLCGGGTAFGELTNRFVAMLGIHAEHIENNLSVYFSPNTHLSGEALGLYYIGTLLPGLKGAERWRTTGECWLLHCVGTHVLADGGYVERAFWYHRYATDIFLHFYLLSLKNGCDLPPHVLERLGTLGRFLHYSLRPDGRIPHIGDDDGGRLLPLDGLPGDDPQGVLQCLAALSECGTCNTRADAFPEEVLWLLGPEAAVSLQQYADSVPKENVYLFPESGYAFLRSGWGPDDTYISFDCGPHGWLNCGHAHADMLSIQIFKGREAVVIDPGTYSYQPSWRDWFRGAEAHAVIRVNGEYPAIPAAPFQWSGVPEHSGLRMLSQNGITSVGGMMRNGFWQHDREIFLLGRELIVVLDRVTVQGESEIEVRFPLAGTDWQVSGDLCSRPGAGIRWNFGVATHLRCEESWLSECYGERVPATVLVLTIRAHGPITLATLVDLGAEAHDIKRIDGEGTELFLVERCKDAHVVATLAPSMNRESACAASAE
ncbi:MAG TPA: alginate lyase family protein [Dissulfurispiraceae bacterium]|nr:alginate lyase family protein [Dissulfurispiraceae bacterium]